MSSTITTVPELTSNMGCTEKLVWKSYATDMSHLFSDYMKGGSMVDTTLVAGGQKIRVHKMVLSATSSFLKKILTEIDAPDPCIILPDEVCMDDLKLLIDFVYRGEIKFQMAQLSSLSKLAQMLGIPGLPGFTEVVFAQEAIGSSKEKEHEDLMIVGDSDDEDEKCQEVTFDPLELNESNSQTAEVLVLETMNVKQSLQAREAAKKSTSGSSYCTANLEEGFKLLQRGHSIGEASKISGVPRTTLYNKAKSCGVICSKDNVKRYTSEQIEQAVKAVSEGQTLKSAADMYGMSKTVLWRRTQALKIKSLAPKSKTNYSPEQKQAAVNALKSGEKTRKIAQEFGIPPATLYREKVKLVESGGLPKESVKKRTLDDILDRQIRVQQAVAACKEGKMTQSSAASHFEVPKTTIWRRLRSNSLPQVNRSMKLELDSVSGTVGDTAGAGGSSGAKETTEFTTFVIDGVKFMTAAEDDAMSMGSSHYIVLATNETDTLPANLQVMLPQNEEGGVVCEVEELAAHEVDMETDCTDDVVKS